ncbi:MAG: glycerol kinase GlpK [Proteobacteria bacterium]|nr:glycerol kinase GlpK [Pseudomonadota bacterium]
MPSVQSEYVLAMDLGTSSATAVLCSLNTLQPVTQYSVELQQSYPKPSWVEQDLEQLWQAITHASKQALAQLKAQDPAANIACIGITNQRETLCVFDKEHGKPLAPAISWQCNRSIEQCQNLKKAGYAKDLHAKTGLSLDPYFSGSKILWLMEHNPEIKTLLTSQKALLGTVDTYLLMRLTHGKTFATEPSNASRTLLLDLQKNSWDEDLLQIFSLPSINNLAAILPSCSHFGSTKNVDGLPDGIPITGILGDQQAALLGQQCLNPLQAKCTYGSGAFLLINTGEKPTFSKSGLLTTIAWQIEDKRYYALEGSSFIAGTGIDYLKDSWQFFKDIKATTTTLQNVTASPHMHFVPAFSGVGSPHWKANARAALFGLSLDTSKAMIIRAMLEGIAFSVADLIEAAESDLSQSLSSLRVDGGVSQNDALLQFQADISNITITRPQKIESTALGAAMIATHGFTGAKTIHQLQNNSQEASHFKPQINTELRKQHRTAWQKAMQACLSVSS